MARPDEEARRREQARQRQQAQARAGTQKFFGDVGDNVRDFFSQKMPKVTAPRPPAGQGVGSFVGQSASNVNDFMNKKWTRKDPERFFGGIGATLGGIGSQKMPDFPYPPFFPKTTPPDFHIGGGLKSLATWGKQDNSVVGAKKGVPPGIAAPPSRFAGGRFNGKGLGSGGALASEEVGLDQPQGPQSLAEILAEVQALMGGSGGGGVSYDPLREQARAQWSDADARTQAMYQELQNSIRGEATGLNTAYDKGIADTNAATQFANNQNAQSAQNINSMVNQQASALGIQEAVANDLNAGNLSGQDQQARAADTAARGQITSNQLIGNRTNALDFNNDLVGSAGLAGGQARLQHSNDLARLLAGYDVEEQQANAQAANNFQEQSMSLAEMLYGANREDAQFDIKSQLDYLREANDQANWQADYDWRTTQPAKASGKAPLLSRADAITKTLSDMGLAEPPKGAQQRADFMKIVRMYEGY